MNPSPIGITKKNEWDLKWNSIFDHYQNDVRHAIYINAVLDQEDKKVLEIGAGSFRDTAFLNKLGIDCWGMDFSTTSVHLAKKRFPHITDKIFQSDAFKIQKIANQFFDVTFHNGLWVLFNEDNKLLELAKEQARITKNKMIITVHNKHNIDFVNYFKHLSQTDPLYNIRFFSVNEISSLLLSVCEFVKIIPVGKGKKFHEDELINTGRFSRSELKEFFDNAGYKYLNISERLLCIGTMKSIA